MDRQLADMLEKQADLTKQPFIQNDITERILEKTGGEGLYHKFEIDLSEAHTDKEYGFSGDRLTVEDVDDAVTIKLGSRKNSPIDLQQIPEIHGPMKRFFITNEAGKGTLKLLGGSKGMIEFKKKIENPLTIADVVLKKNGDSIRALEGDNGKLIESDTDLGTVLDYLDDEHFSTGFFKPHLIFVKPGEYETTELMSMDTPDIEIFGGFGQHRVDDTYGRRACFKMADGASVVNMFHFGSRNGVIKGMFFDGNDANATISGACLWYKDHDMLIENCTIRHTDGTGFMAQDLHGIDIRLLCLENIGGKGVNLRGCRSCHIFGLNMWTIEDAGLLLYGNTRNCIVFDPHIAVTNEAALRLSVVDGDSPHHNYIAGATIHSSQKEAILLEGAQYNTIIGSEIRDSSLGGDNTYDDIKLDTSTNHSIYNRFIANSNFKEDTALDPRYGISEVDANQDYNIFAFNVMRGQTGNYNFNGLNSVDRDNL